ncbi:geranylgeranylglyceryl phosphate synthase-like protein [Salinarchaeum sp. Harcht-Bsk1]|uniref:phosphoglycerol geranylgeranyltransferase n=1 Tax=Salinarchaeum sp. Harcht-Bsk1 TaxID=1333523 RepID=UPI0003422F78|nr:putative phosphoglycerol geranylgeranyltransferase [Salinarchaeum sp. Harcht-Bsk1]AGN00776.1 geranylgeranylglyceryl phosphate synthase-like protein [Salinarchaeum sp. Harcht-Bsk1]
MTAPWTEWDHILKIDPDKELVDGETFADVCQTGTDALEIGGTLDITSEKMSRVIEACAEYDVPLYQEPSNPAVVVDDEAVDGFLVPVVFNAGDMAWMTGFHKEWVKTDHVDWARTTTEGYIILNPDSSVGQLTEADCDLDAEDVAAYAEIAEEMFGQEIVYLEYSGMLGDPEKVRAAADVLEETTLFYGGGIHDYDSAHTMASEADVVIVGDLVHEEGVDAVQETVQGAKDA